MRIGDLTDEQSDFFSLVIEAVALLQVEGTGRMMHFRGKVYSLDHLPFRDFVQYAGIDYYYTEEADYVAVHLTLHRLR